MNRNVLKASLIAVATLAATPAAAADFVNIQPNVNSNISTYNGGPGYPTTPTTTIGGITFQLASFGGGLGVIQLDQLRSTTINAAFRAVDTAYVIINSAFGQFGRTSGSITFNGGTGSQQTSLVQGVNIRDHFNGSGNNVTTSAFATANYGTGARFDVYRFDISQLGGTLNSINFACNGACSRDNGLPLLAGVTLTQEAVAAVPEPSTWAMMLIGFGAVGFSMRRRKASNGRAMQLA